MIGRPGIGPAAVEADRAALRSVGIDDDALRGASMNQFGPQIFDPRPRVTTCFHWAAARRTALRGVPAPDRT
ncbi:MAG: hypothetical protein ACRDRY_13325 [Pseudonocardiaceae bacterium]